MTWILACAGLLAVTSAMSFLLRARPEAALRTGMVGAAVSCGLMLVPALQVLLDGGAPGLSGFELPLGILRLRLDAVGAWFVLSIAIVGGCAAVHSLGYLEARHEPAWVYSCLYCLLLFSLFGLVCSADAVLFLVFWELMLIGAFLLVGFHDRDAGARKAAWVYLTANHLGTAFFVLPMFVVLWLRSGSTRFEDFTAVAATPAVFLLALGGFGTKAGLVPLHIWLPIAHPAAPAPVSAILSGVMVKMGVYGIVRWISWCPVLPRWCAIVLIIIGAVSGLLGVLYAVAQHDLKRLLAFHTVENVGIIVLGLGVGLLGRTLANPALECAGFAGALLHVLNHSLFKGLLFLSAGAIVRAAGTTAIDRLGGLCRSGRLHSGLFLVGALSICGLPPFNGFVSEWLIYGSLAGSAIRGSTGEAACAVLGFVALAAMGGLAIACFAKAFGAIFLGEARDPGMRPQPVASSMLAPMIVLALLCVAIGLCAGPAVAIVGRVLPAMGGADATSLRPFLPPSRLTGAAATFAVLVLVLLAVRSILSRPQGARVGTWGCGFAGPTPRMQYTATAFAWTLVSTNRAVLGSEREVEPPRGVLPTEPGRVHSHTPDASFDSFFEPLFRVFRRAFLVMQHLTWSGEASTWREPEGARPGHARTLRRLLHAVRRRGIHISITYIILVLAALFVIEAIRHTGRDREAAAPPTGGQKP